MKAELRESIVQIIQRKYPQRIRSTAASLLSEYQIEDDELRERVLRCVVSLAGKDLKRLNHYLECAHEDHRNLILWHEHSEQSLKKFLDEDGSGSSSK